MNTIFRRNWNLFGKVLLKLTALNTGVLLLVLIIYNVLLYFIISNQLYANVDNDMQRSIAGVSKAARQPAADWPNGDPVKPVRLPPPPPDDPRIMVLFFNVEGALINPYPSNSLKNEDLIKLACQSAAGFPQNQVYNGQHYRYIKSSFSEDLPLIFIPPQLVRVKDVIVIANVNPENRLLNTFMIVSALGTLVVFLAILGAGYFLAQRALIPINESWGKQEQFVADASHEMRTPLAVIKSHAELLLHSPDNTIEKESARIAAIIKETTRLSNLVAKLLLLARSDSNQVELEFQPIQLRDLVAGVVTQFQPIAGLKNISVSLQAEELAEFVGDKERIAQLLVILLDNAVKYTPEGGKVIVRVIKKNNAAEIMVNDTGMGIPPGDLPRIFDRFYRADQSRAAQHRGTGLGLAIAKWIVEKHSGSIRAESKVGAGTSLIVTLPLRRYFFS